MLSPRPKRNGSRSGSIFGASGSTGSGRFDFGSAARFRTFDCPSRRRASSCSNVASLAFGTIPTDDAKRWNQSFFTIALRSLMAIDLWLSRRLGVCACESSLLGSIRPLVKLTEFTGHGIPWLACTAYLFLVSNTAAEQEVSINLLMALALDRILAGIVKALVCRYWSAPSRSDNFSTVPLDRCTLPSGLATRATMCARFLLAHLVVDAPLRVLVLSWATLVGLSRVLLGQNNVTGMVFGLCIGYCQYSLVERFWVPLDWLQDILYTVMGESQAMRG
ncbi:phospholipid phosphatase 6-like [Chanos chanos]|uniref:Phospholipid phosphatase 6-like n=1 Tax=Chanos chanos TaxID=29144 RepID=A0A6J2VCX0_CHACN|nr:phospholipid phosphatase 6-like [Chanos chanos]